MENRNAKQDVRPEFSPNADAHADDTGKPAEQQCNKIKPEPAKTATADAADDSAANFPAESTRSNAGYAKPIRTNAGPDDEYAEADDGNAKANAAANAGRPTNISGNKPDYNDSHT